MVRKLLAVMVAVLFVAGIALAQEQAATVKYAVGADMDFVLDKEIEVKDIPGINAEYSAQRYNIKADVNVNDIVILTPKAGLSTAQANTAYSSTSIELESDLGWNIGMDVQANVLKSKYVDLAGIGSYRYSRVGIESVKLGVLEIDNPLKSVLSTHEWEIGGRLSKDLSTIWTNLPSLTPYLDLVYSDLRGNMDVDLSIVNLDTDVEATNKFGMRLGCNLAPIKGWEGGIELRLIDETALCGTVKYKF